MVEYELYVTVLYLGQYVMSLCDESRAWWLPSLHSNCPSKGSVFVNVSCEVYSCEVYSFLESILSNSVTIELSLASLM